MIKNRKNYSTDPIEPLFYIFLGQDLNEDENCFLNYTNKMNGYYVDSNAESDSTQTKFTYDEFQQAKKDLSNLWFGDEDDCLIPVGEIDDLKNENKATIGFVNDDGKFEKLLEVDKFLKDEPEGMRAMKDVMSDND
ncbi:hypothetical protein BN20_037 [Lactobacillus phage EV3]|nr:hypothetical protein BN20_037 [Lactobacillus phage EV3]